MVDKDRTIALDMKANKRDKEKVCFLMKMGGVAVMGHHCQADELYHAQAKQE